MSYQVVWDVGAFRQLDQIWSETVPIEPVASAFDKIERRLGQTPHVEGESRGRGRRIVIVPPLGAIYRVHERLKETHVLEVWLIKKRTH